MNKTNYNIKVWNHYKLNTNNTELYKYLFTKYLIFKKNIRNSHLYFAK